MDIFAPGKKRNTCFIVKNIITGSNKVVRIFQYPIPVGQTRDILAIPGVSESDIRASLLKGELLHKILSQEITIVSSDIDLLQFDALQKQFLMDSGVTCGLSITQTNGMDAALYQNVMLVGVVDGVNTVFTIADGYKFVQNDEYVITVYYNGVRQDLTIDYIVMESGGVGTGYDTVIFNDPPDPGFTIISYITADYYVINTGSGDCGCD